VRVARPLAALAAASLPLWPSVASAEEQRVTATHEFTIPNTGTKCTVDLEMYVYEGGAVFKLVTRPDVPDCAIDVASVFGYAVDADGEEVSGRAGGCCGGHVVDLQLYQGVRIVEGQFDVAFEGCSQQCRQFYTLTPK
jgi:hypothetical protein